MLSFLIANDGKEVQIVCDGTGAGTLIDALEKIQHIGGQVHLRTS